MSVLAALSARRLADPQAEALVGADGEIWSLARLDDWSAALAHDFAARGVGAGTRVMVALGVAPQLYATLIALWRLGAVAVFPEPSAGVQGLRHALRAARPTAFVGLRWLAALAACLSLRPSLARPLPLRPGGMCAAIPAWPDDHPALISFTSGSTGRPKGIVRSHGFLLAQQNALAPLLAPNSGGARDLVCLPLFVLASIGLGATAVLPNADLRRPGRVDTARLAAQIEAQRVTRLLAPPSIATRLAAEPEFARLRQVFTGGGPVWPDAARAMRAAAPHAEIFAVYGSTEAEPIAHQALHHLTADDAAISEAGGGLLAGTPVPDLALRLQDGEIQVAGAHVNRGYLDAAQDAALKVHDAGRIWHRTGDLGRLDDSGRLWLLGRCDGRVGRYTPFSIEVAARSWPGVRQAALIAHDGRPWLAIEGDAHFAAQWRARLAAFPDIQLCIVARLPLDRRHAAKVDYRRLRQLIVGEAYCERTNPPPGPRVA